jgi:hypothetical protein
MRTEAVRNEILRLKRQAPFRPFVLNLENGDRITIKYPETIAFDPEINKPGKGSPDFYVISGNLRFYGTFEAVMSVGLQDTGEPGGS